MFIISSSQTTVSEKLIPFIRPFSRFHFTNITVFYSNLISHCLSLKSLSSAKAIHAELIKYGIQRDTFLCNCLTDAYYRLGAASDGFQAFRGIPVKNIHSWNILLGGCFKSGCPDTARNVFLKMPERDIVTWNSMISGLSSSGLVDCAWELFLEMEVNGLRPNGFTFSIVVSAISSVSRGKLIHGRIIRSGLIFSNIVVGNTLIDMYGKLGLADYAFCVFLTMSKLDTVSWNSMIAACGTSGYGEGTVDLFCSMRALGFSPDPYTLSTVFTSCSGLQDLETGKQVFAHCIKTGFISNSIVSSAIIDMFANCSRLDDSVRVFEEMTKWDSAICSSMISSYATHGFPEDAGLLFVLTLRMNIHPTEFAVGSILNSMCNPILVDQGTQIHCLLIKLGFEPNTVISSLLVDMYTKYGLIDDAIKVFGDMTTKDIVLWNTLILGFARNGRELEALKLFEELVDSNLQPDRITLAGLLLACGHAGYINEGWRVFLSMEEKYNVIPRYEHYTYVVEMFSRAGKHTEAMEIIESMPQKNNASIWCVLLGACRTRGNERLADRVAERMIELESRDPLPYLVLVQMYAIRGMWEGVARVRMLMKERGVKKVVGCSWIGVRNQVFVFKSDQILHTRGEDIHDMLKLLIWEMQVVGYSPQEFLVVGDGGED
ncbi:pentatricopeptide repeat-containing protein At1g43980, mitochondrial [Aristolochia californica]|uniref:pentatricopeptide repeat-containing protein At1g43980, mitochondrial n=1 Tax=Aristolochia californica TaxID=171875 RepID=UPI0035D854B4